MGSAHLELGGADPCRWRAPGRRLGAHR